jgi:PST family polysaccharide transporter
LKERTAKAVLWMMVDVGGSQGLSFVIYAVLTRILGPGEYGIFSLSLAITAVANVVLLEGFSDALIQREVVTEDDLSTAFWTNIALGTAMAAGLFFLSPWIASAFGAPELSPVMRGMSVLCVLRALVSVHSALCRRELKMSLFAMRAISGYVLGGAVGIGLAVTGWGVWSLVLVQISQAVVIMVVMWTTIQWRPRFLFSVASFRDMARFTQHFIPASILNSVKDKVDNVLIGLFLDVTAVGYYALGLKVIQVVGLLAMAPLQAVMMPVLARIADQRQAFAHGYTRLVTASAAAWMPAAVALAVVAPKLVPLAFGGQWVGAVPVLQAMCFAGATVPLWFFTGQALGALGRPDLYVVVTVAQLVLASVAFVVATQSGIVAVGWAWAGVSIACVPLHLTVLRRGSGVGFGTLLANVGRITLCGLAMAIAMLIARRAIGGASLWGMFVELAIGGAVYLALLETVLLPGYVSSMTKLAGDLIPARAPR